MSTIKEMVESLEDDSFHFIQHVHSDLSKHNQNMNSLDEIKQNSFDKIIKYMKKEINKIDKIRKNEKNKDKVQLMIKEFLVNLKWIEVNQANSDEKEEDKTPNTSKQEQNQKQISNNKEQLTNDSLKIMNDYMIEDWEWSSIKEINPLSDMVCAARRDSIHKDEENFDKDVLEPTPNKLPPVTNFSSNKLSPKSENERINLNIGNKNMNSKYSQIRKRRSKQMSHNASKEGFDTPKIEDEPKEFLPNTPYEDTGKIIYK